MLRKVQPYKHQFSPDLNVWIHLELKISDLPNSITNVQNNTHSGT